jgi:hypothetical protein
MMAEAVRSTGGLDGVYAECRRYWDLGDVQEWHSVTWDRTGHSTKEQPIYRHAAGEVERIGWSRACYPRRRDVNGVPAVLNMLNRPYFERLMGVLESCPYTSHGRPEAIHAQVLSACAAAGRPTTALYEDDVSAFDHRPSQSLMVSSYDAGQALGLGDTTYLKYVSTLPFYAPPWLPGYEGFLYRRAGGVASGSIDTSPTDSLLNAARVVLCVAASKDWSVPDTWLRLLASDWWFKVNGDDTLLLPPLGWKPERYVEASEAAFQGLAA